MQLIIKFYHALLPIAKVVDKLDKYYGIIFLRVNIIENFLSRKTNYYIPFPPFNWKFFPPPPEKASSDQ